MKKLPSCAAAVILASLAACGSSGTSYPHAWCAPLIAQFHAKESRQAYLNGLAALQKSGAPVAALIADENQVVKDMAAMNDASSGTAGYTAVANAPADVAKVGADLKSLNTQCDQPADAYKSDIM